MKKKIKEKIELLEKNIDQVDQKIKETLKLNTKIEGYYNQEVLLKSEGVVFRSKENEKIDFILRDSMMKVVNGLFDYEGLPDDIPQEMIEKFLFFSGKVAFFEFGGKYYISKFGTNGILDWKGDHTKIQPILENGKTLKWFTIEKDCVIIKNDWWGNSTWYIIKPFIEKLSSLFEVMNQNLNLSKTRWLLQTSRISVQDLKAQIQKLLDKNGSVAITSNDDFGEVKDFPLFEKYDPTVYWEDFDNTFNFMLSLIGVNSNPNEDKKERMIVDEVNSSREKVSLILQSFFKGRNEAIKKINKMFNLNIKLVLKVDYEEKEKDQEDQEGEKNEENNN